MDVAMRLVSGPGGKIPATLRAYRMRGGLSVARVSMLRCGTVNPRATAYPDVEKGWRRTVAVMRLSVVPSVLRWARETAGLDVATAAERVGVKRDRVEQWETGACARDQADPGDGGRLRSASGGAFHARASNR